MSTSRNLEMVSVNSVHCLAKNGNNISPIGFIRMKVDWFRFLSEIIFIFFLEKNQTILSNIEKLKKENKLYNHNEVSEVRIL